LAVVTGAPPADDLMRRALASHFRNVFEQLSLPGWSPTRITSRVSTIGETRLREAYAGSGAVVAVPHSGNWDWAGAWACRVGLPVTSVAERLGDAEYAAFSSFRRKLGMEVMAHRDPDVVPTLVRAVGRRRVIALLADRDLRGAGVEVDWAGQRVRMPVGPALVARRSRAALLPAVSQFTPEGMVVRIGPAIEIVRGAGGLQEMTQRVADFFAARIAEQPQDWHMLQPFFPDTTS
jgi:lauroyl/myristoyl acyltransferase